MPRISIITPTYVDIDAKTHWLNEMIQSVLNQTITDWELILIDDKSPLNDLIAGVRSQYVSDTRIRWLENANNEGPAKTRNTAVALAESDCILPLDSDDMLAGNDVLEQMYEVWQQDKTKIIYGNLQQLTPNGPNSFIRGKVFNLASYTFELAMNLNGIMPVTAMHSVDCHNKAGGWKHELHEGLEDLEYWIAAGERGFCGQKIPITTLLYRRQENSRAYIMKHVKQNFTEMQNKIKSMHAPIYRGEFPDMACGCGKSGGDQIVPNADPIVTSASNQRVAKISELSGYKDNELEWVTYQGAKKGSFNILVRGPSNLPSSYMVLGTGHAFQVHKRHHEFFSQRQHMGFRINQPDPRKQPEPEIEQPKPRVIEQPKPELSTLIRLDAIANKTRQAEVQPLKKNDNEVIVEPNAPSSYSAIMGGNIAVTIDENDPRSIEQDFIDVLAMPSSELSRVDITSLGFSDKITKMLSQDHWTVDRLAKASIDDLTIYDGIGAKRARSVIDKAQELIKG